MSPFVPSVVFPSGSPVGGSRPPIRLNLRNLRFPPRHPARATPAPPVCFREVRRQVRAVCHEFGLWPGRVNIEMLRDVGRSASERKKMDDGIRTRTAEKERNRKAYGFPTISIMKNPFPKSLPIVCWRY